MADELASVLDAIRQNGYQIVHGGKHLLVKNKDGGTVATIPSSPSDHRTYKNMVSQLRRANIIEHDPRRTGQRKREGYFPPPSDRQRAVGARAQQLIDSLGIRTSDFASHMMAVADRKRMHPPAGINSARRALYTITTDYRRASEWLVDLVEATCNDIEAAPQTKEDTEMVVTPIRSSARMKPYQRARDLHDAVIGLQSFYEIKPREGRTYGHGTWRVAADVATEQLHRDGMDQVLVVHSETHSRDTLLTRALIGGRLASAAKGDSVNTATQQIADALIKGYENGIYKEMITRRDTARGISLMMPDTKLAQAADEIKETYHRTTLPPIPVAPLPALHKNEDAYEHDASDQKEAKEAPEVTHETVPLHVRVLGRLAYAEGHRNLHTGFGNLQTIIDLAEEIRRLEENK